VSLEYKINNCLKCKNLLLLLVLVLYSIWDSVVGRVNQEEVNAVNEVDEVALFRKDQITLHSQRDRDRCTGVRCLLL